MYNFNFNESDMLSKSQNENILDDLEIVEDKEDFNYEDFVQQAIASGDVDTLILINELDIEDEEDDSLENQEVVEDDESFSIVEKDGQNWKVLSTAKGKYNAARKYNECITKTKNEVRLVSLKDLEKMNESRKNEAPANPESLFTALMSELNTIYKCEITDEGFLRCTDDGGNFIEIATIKNTDPVEMGMRVNFTDGTQSETVYYVYDNIQAVNDFIQAVFISEVNAYNDMNEVEAEEVQTEEKEDIELEDENQAQEEIDKNVEEVEEESEEEKTESLKRKSKNESKVTPEKIKKEVEEKLKNIYKDYPEFYEEYVYVDTYYRDEDGRLVVEVRSELGYDDMISLSVELDSIVQKYDKYAYFDLVDGGIMNAILDFDEKYESLNESDRKYEFHNEEDVGILTFKFNFERKDNTLICKNEYGHEIEIELEEADEEPEKDYIEQEIVNEMDFYANDLIEEEEVEEDIEITSSEVIDFKYNKETKKGSFEFNIFYETEKDEEINESLNESDDKFNYMMLDRLKTDCEYFLGNGNGYEKHLWAGNVEDQIAEMRKIYDKLPEKPDWISLEDIDRYEKEMLAKRDSKNEVKEITRDEWNKTPKDYKMIKDGKPYLVYLDDETHTTVLGPCKIIDESLNENNWQQYASDYYVTGMDGFMEGPFDSYEDAEEFINAQVNKGKDRDDYSIITQEEEEEEVEELDESLNEDDEFKVKVTMSDGKEKFYKAKDLLDAKGKFSDLCIRFNDCELLQGDKVLYKQHESLDGDIITVVDIPLVTEKLYNKLVGMLYGNKQGENRDYEQQQNVLNFLQEIEDRIPLESGISVDLEDYGFTADEINAIKKIVREERTDESLNEKYCTKAEITRFLKSHKATEVAFGRYVSEIRGTEKLFEMHASGSKKIAGTYDSFDLIVYPKGALYREELATGFGKITTKYYIFGVEAKNIDESLNEDGTVSDMGVAPIMPASYDDIDDIDDELFDITEGFLFPDAEEETDEDKEEEVNSLMGAAIEDINQGQPTASEWIEDAQYVFNSIKDDAVKNRLRNKYSQYLESSQKDLANHLLQVLSKGGATLRQLQDFERNGYSDKDLSDTLKNLIQQRKVKTSFEGGTTRYTLVESQKNEASAELNKVIKDLAANDKTDIDKEINKLYKEEPDAKSNVTDGSPILGATSPDNIVPTIDKAIMNKAIFAATSYANNGPQMFAKLQESFKNIDRKTLDDLMDSKDVAGIAKYLYESEMKDNKNEDTFTDPQMNVVNSNSSTVVTGNGPETPKLADDIDPAPTEVQDLPKDKSEIENTNADNKDDQLAKDSGTEEIPTV